jgi:hypothetical protein
MGPRGRLAHFLFTAALLACDPYHRRTGEFHAGPVDPVNFPPPYLGGGDRYSTGSGSFEAARAFVNGVGVEYFAFPFSDARLGAADPLELGTADLPADKVYVFDSDATAGNPFGAQQCRTPAGYVYDQRRDDVHYDEQGAIFTALPEASYPEGDLPSWDYDPVVAQVAVSGAGRDCQGVKSEKTLLGGGTLNADGNYLAWAIIDPGAPVYNFGAADPEGLGGVGLQRWGWFDHYLLAYIDGGYIPLDLVTTPGVARMVTQRVYHPNTGGLGEGNDVFQFARGAAGYSPVCEVFTYTPVDPGNPPQSEAGVLADDPNPAPADPPYAFCLQQLP